MDVNNKVLRTVKGRTHFISCAYYCCLAVESGVSQNEINRTLTEFFSGYPSTSPEYNHTVSAGSAKPASVQTRRDVMRSLLPAADEAGKNGEQGNSDSEQNGLDKPMEQFEGFSCERYA